jgi:hypothetical protein
LNFQNYFKNVSSQMKLFHYFVWNLLHPKNNIIQIQTILTIENYQKLL